MTRGGGSIEYREKGISGLRGDLNAGGFLIAIYTHTHTTHTHTHIYTRIYFYTSSQSTLTTSNSLPTVSVRNPTCTSLSHFSNISHSLHFQLSPSSTATDSDTMDAWRWASWYNIIRLIFFSMPIHHPFSNSISVHKYVLLPQYKPPLHIRQGYHARTFEYEPQVHIALPRSHCANPGGLV